MISWLCLFSQIPSQAHIINSISSDRSLTVTSGTGLTLYSSKLSVLFLLYLQSPRARLRLRPPSIRPQATYEPALVILLYSISSSGLWSNDNSTAFPPMHITDLLSPALAQYIFLFSLSIYKMLQVQPTLSYGQSSVS